MNAKHFVYLGKAIAFVLVGLTAWAIYEETRPAKANLELRLNNQTLTFTINPGQEVDYALPITGGTPPYKCTGASGLPPNLYLSEDCHIRGVLLPLKGVK